MPDREGAGESKWQGVAMPISFPYGRPLHPCPAMLSERLLLHTQKKVELFITTDVLLTFRCRRLRWGRCGLSRTDCRPRITTRKMNGLLHFRFHCNRTAVPPGIKKHSLAASSFTSHPNALLFSRDICSSSREASDIPEA